MCPYRPNARWGGEVEWLKALQGPQLENCRKQLSLGVRKPLKQLSKLGLGTELGRVPTELRQYYREPIHIKLFITWERIWAHTRERETWRHPSNSLKHNKHEMFWRVLTFLGLYVYRQNADTMTESIHKNWIYSIAWNATEFVNFWINKRRPVT